MSCFLSNEFAIVKFKVIITKNTIELLSEVNIVRLKSQLQEIKCVFE